MDQRGRKSFILVSWVGSYIICKDLYNMVLNEQKNSDRRIGKLTLKC